MSKPIFRESDKRSIILEVLKPVLISPFEGEVAGLLDRSGDERNKVAIPNTLSFRRQGGLSSFRRLCSEGGDKDCSPI